MTGNSRKSSPGQGLKPAPETPPDRPSRRNVLGFGLVADGALGASGCFLWPVPRQAILAAPAEATAVSISMSGFAPNALRARAGVPIELTDQPRQFPSFRRRRMAPVRYRRVGAGLHGRPAERVPR